MVTNLKTRTVTPMLGGLIASARRQTKKVRVRKSVWPTRRNGSSALSGSVVTSRIRCTTGTKETSYAVWPSFTNFPTVRIQRLINEIDR